MHLVQRFSKALILLRWKKNWILVFQPAMCFAYYLVKCCGFSQETQDNDSAFCQITLDLFTVCRTRLRATSSSEKRTVWPCCTGITRLSSESPDGATCPRPSNVATPIPLLPTIFSVRGAADARSLSSIPANSYFT